MIYAAIYLLIICADTWCWDGPKDSFHRRTLNAYSIYWLEIIPPVVGTTAHRGYCFLGLLRQGIKSFIS